jgi:hypothetical protein
MPEEVMPKEEVLVQQLVAEEVLVQQQLVERE